MLSAIAPGCIIKSPDDEIVKEAPTLMSDPVTPLRAFMMFNTCDASIKLPLCIPDVLMYPIKFNLELFYNKYDEF